MDKQKLIELRKQISDNLLPLVLDGEGSPEDRIELVMNMIRMGNADETVYRRAFDTIMSLEDNNQRASLLFELLSEVEADIETIESQEPEPSLEQPATTEQTQ